MYSDFDIEKIITLLLLIWFYFYWYIWYTLLYLLLYKTIRYQKVGFPLRGAK